MELKLRAGSARSHHRPSPAWPWPQLQAAWVIFGKHTRVSSGARRSEPRLPFRLCGRLETANLVAIRAGGFLWKSGAEITRTQVLEFPGKPPESPATDTSPKFETRPRWGANVLGAQTVDFQTAVRSC